MKIMYAEKEKFDNTGKEMFKGYLIINRERGQFRYTLNGY